MPVSPRPGTVFLTANLLWLLAALWYTSDAAIDLPPLVSLLGGAGLLLCVILVRAFLVRRQRLGRPLTRREVLAWSAFPAAAALSLLWAWSGAGLRLRLALSAAALRAYPVTAAPDTHDSFRNPAERIGLFWVSEVQLIEGCRRFVTTRVFMDDAGLAFCPVGAPPRVDEDSYRALGAGWWIWKRSWQVRRSSRATHALPSAAPPPTVE
jgi:hypothetical protein